MGAEIRWSISKSAPSDDDQHVSHQRQRVFVMSDLVLTSHDDVLWFWHHATLLGDQGVPLVSRQAVGGEEAIVLLHAHGCSGQLTTGVVHRQGTPAATGLLFTHEGIMETFLLWLCLSGLAESHFTSTYASRSDLYSRTPEMRCAANLQKRGVGCRNRKNTYSNNCFVW